VRAFRVARSAANPADLVGRVLCHELRGEDGRIAIAKGRVLDDTDCRRALELSWSELHLLALADDDVHEDAAGDRIARLVAGDGVTVRPPSGGHWPLMSTRRGLLQVDAARLARLNELDGPCVYSLYDGQVVETDEVVARAKILPFAITARTMSDVESVVAHGGRTVTVRPFEARRIGAVVHETLGDRAVNRFREAVSEKTAWFGSSLGTLVTTAPSVDRVADALRAARGADADIVLVAGTKAMDLLDPTFEALERVGAQMVAHGVPAHPGSLLWLADWEGVHVVGMPTCGLFAQATVFDLVMARLLAGERLDRRELAALGHGGFLTRAMAFRLPAYRAAAERGAVE
jgi:hypothetical protein